MRLDKFFSELGLLSRREVARAVSRGEISVNGIPVKRADVKLNEQTDRVTLRGEPIVYQKFVYMMLNKPSGYVSATEDGRLPVVTELFPETLRRRGIFPCGRLDKDTLGLMLVTDDGALSHLLLSPKRHVAKVYAFSLDAPLPLGAEERFAAGVALGDEICRPSRVTLSADRRQGEILLVEGKYHQIKRMMQTEGCTVTYLERLRFGGLSLDPALARGEWRYLTDEEIALLRAAAQNPTTV